MGLVNETEGRFPATREGFTALVQRRIREKFSHVPGWERLSHAVSEIDRLQFVPKPVIQGIFSSKIPFNIQRKIAESGVYHDAIIGIDPGKSSMSQPSLVVDTIAQSGVLELLEQSSSPVEILEIGTASGYNAALLAKLDPDRVHVNTVEIDPQLVEHAQNTLRASGINNVDVYQADPSELGVPRALRKDEQKLYNTIIVTAGFPNIPFALTEQLAEGGSIIIPVIIGDEYISQSMKSFYRIQSVMVVGTKASDGIRFRSLGFVDFVPVQGVSQYGYSIGTAGIHQAVEQLLYAVIAEQS